MGHQAVEKCIMLFNSPEFIFFFLPVTLLGLFVLAKVASRSLVVGWLIAANLFFYGWWNPPYLLLLVTSVLFNFSIGKSQGNLRPCFPCEMVTKGCPRSGIMRNCSHDAQHH